MSFFSRNKDKNTIPPVNDYNSGNPRAGLPNSVSPRPGYRPSNSNAYNASRDGDPYAAPPSRPAPYNQNSYGSQGGGNEPPQSYGDRYSRSRPIGGDPYRGNGAQLDSDRTELFSGYKPQQAGGGSGRFFDGPARRPTPPPGEEDDEDVEGIKQQTRYVKQESLTSTRNALRLAREAEETGRNTLTRLGDQSEKLADTERHLDVAKGHSQRADDRTDELKQLNRSIFRPVITFNKDGKRRAQEAKVQARYDEERDERERAMMDIRESQNRIGRAATYGTDTAGRGLRTQDALAARKEQRKRFQFEATASDDELEDELDENLEEISDVTKKLKALGAAMGQELDNQNKRIDRIDSKTQDVDRRVVSNTERLRKIK